MRPALLLALAIAAPLTATTFSDGPPPAHTGGFGEPTCAVCHLGEPVAGRGIEVRGVPATYRPGERYRLELVLAHEGIGRAGFQLAARFAKPAGAQAGVLTAADARARVVSQAGVAYALQTEAGSSVDGGTARWTLEWTAPACRGEVVFNVAANAADGDASSLGDVIYTQEARTTCAPAPTIQSPAADTVAFTGVTVVPMDEERRLRDHTVLVVDGVIRAVGPTAQVRVGAGATRIDARGKFLMPGLAEMHAHVPPAAAGEQALADVLLLYAANGITMARSMLGAPPHLALRERLARGEVLGPRLIAGAPSLNGNSAPDSATARALVRAHKAAGYDFLKLHPGLRRDVYDAIVDESRKVGITFAGHVSQAVGLEHTLASRQSTIDHLDGYVEAVVADSLRARMVPGGVPLGTAMRSVTAERIREVARATRQAGVYNVPTAALWEHFFSARTPEEMLAWPEMKYATAQQRSGWTQQKQNFMQSDAQNGVTPEERALFLDVRRRILRALADEGALLLMGTDAPQMFSVPGFSLRRELALMAEVGIPPYVILQSGTVNVARYVREVLRQPAEFGTVAPGMRADLLLLDADPLVDVRNVARVAGVMIGGRWLSRTELDRRLAEVAARAAG